MAKAAERNTRRPFVDATHAAALLGCDPRTARKMITQGRLEGEKVPSANGRRFEWRIFTDQPLIEQARATPAPIESMPDSAAAASADIAHELAQLRAEIAELRSARVDERIRAVQDQNIELVAAMQAMTEVLGEFQQGTEHFQAGSARLANVVSALLDRMASTNTPDSPQGIEQL